MVMTLSSSYPPSVLAQNDLVIPLPEFHSFIDGGPDTTTRELDEDNGQVVTIRMTWVLVRIVMHMKNFRDVFLR